MGLSRMGEAIRDRRVCEGKSAIDRVRLGGCRDGLNTLKFWVAQSVSRRTKLDETGSAPASFSPPLPIGVFPPFSVHSPPKKHEERRFETISSSLVGL